MVKKTELDDLVEQAIMAELKPVDVEELYRKMLDEVYGEIQVCGISFFSSRVLEELDPIAFSCGCNDWIDGEVGERLTDEIGGQYYDYDEAEEIRERITEEFKAE